MNYWAVLVAAAASMVIGSVWYSPMLFGNVWMKLVGKTQEDIKGNRMAPMTWAIVFALVTAWILGVVIAWAGASSVGEGLQVGFWMWFGFVLTSMAMNAMFEGRPAKLLWINLGNQLVSLLVAGAILGGWI
ncbi:MAG: DUF1761 domain-containing protein [Candidatus Kerfeldbacteria bacterium]|nr:DUF1761 domain-containing protein [Candidatus Kerfeldbacteria bacterium]